MKKIVLSLVLLMCVFAISVGCGTNEYTVKFNSYGGTDIASQKVKEGETAKRPEDPTKEGFIFLDWYLEDSVFDFNTPITSNIVLNALWEESREELTTEELNEKINALVEAYKNSLTGAIKVQLINGSDKYNVNLKYHLSATDKIVAYEYNVNQVINGNEMKQYTYVKDEIVYSMINENSGSDKLDKDSTKYILKNCGVSVILDKVIPFYNETDFYNALVFSKKIDETTFEYTLDFSSYKGSLIDLAKNDQIKLNVTIIENNITFIKLISVSGETVNEIGVGFKGLEVPKIDYPENIK